MFTVSDKRAARPERKRFPRTVFRGLPCLLLCFSGGAMALTPMTASEMSSVTGQDGLTVTINDGATGWSAGQIKWTNDPGDATNQGSLALDNLSLNTLGSTDFKLTADAWANASGVPGTAITANWQSMELTIGGIHTYNPSGTASAASGGQIGFYSQGNFLLTNEKGLANQGSVNSQFELNFSTPTSPGDFILRQGGPGSPEFSFANANMTLATPDATFATNCLNGANCTFGIDPNGLLLKADTLNLDLNFDLMYKASPTNFDRTGRSPLIKLGWTGRDSSGNWASNGGLSNFSMSIGPSSTPIAGAQSLQINTSFGYEPGFSLILGQAGTNNTRVRFNGFTDMRISPTTPTFSIPLTLDVIPATATLRSLCYGDLPTSCTASTDESVSLPVTPLNAGESALAAEITDGEMHAYNTTVDVVDPANGTNNTYNWSLGFTFGRMDSNIVIYPGFDNGSTVTTGMTADVLMTINSPGFWQNLHNTAYFLRDNYGNATKDAAWAQNSHFFIADTSTAVDLNGDGNPGDQFAFGVLNADLIWKADNMAIRITGNGATAFANLAAAGDTTIPSGGISFPGGFWLQSSNNVRYEFRGVLGGSDLTAMSHIVPIGIADVRLDTDKFLFALYPGSTTPASIGFDGMLDLNNNTYVSLAEPSKPTAEAGVYNISGRVMWRNGIVQVRSGAQNTDGRPSLTIANDLLIGSTADAGTTPLPLVGTVKFSGRPLGEIAIPSGQFYSNITLKPQ